jgi:23S rRNA (guanosine2251-2'-O)-methyltransferase
MQQENTKNVIYGIHAVEELIKHRGNEIERLFFESGKTSSALFNVMKVCRKERLAYQQAPACKLDSLAQTSKHQGVVALCGQKSFLPAEAIDDLIKNSPHPPLFFVPASIEDPRNLGSLIRSCVGFGVTALLLERKNTAFLGSTVAKSSAGMMEHISIVKPKNLEGLIASLKAKGFLAIGAHQNGSVRPDEADLTGPLIVITGGEHRDIPPYLLKLCDSLVKIPMESKAPSLNVSVAGAILLYECVRQRMEKRR